MCLDDGLRLRATFDQQVRNRSVGGRVQVLLGFLNDDETCPTLSACDTEQYRHDGENRLYAAATLGHAYHGSAVLLYKSKRECRLVEIDTGSVHGFVKPVGHIGHESPMGGKKMRHFTYGP